jgi:hypothetical protein
MYGSADDVAGHQLATLLEIESLYDKKLYSKLIKLVKIEFGLIKR